MTERILTKAGPGRPPGSPNKFKLARDVMIEMNFHPLEEMVRRFQDPTSNHMTKDRMLTEIIKYTMPQLKSVEVTGTDGGPVQSLIKVLFENIKTIEHKQQLDSNERLQSISSEHNVD